MSKSWRLWLLAVTVLALTALALLFAARPAHAATITVNGNGDTLADDGVCILREAIDNANDTTDGDVHDDCAAGNPAGADDIDFAADYIITLASSQLPVVTSEMTITGNGPANTIIQASTCNPVTLPGGCAPATWRIFEVAAAGNLTLNGLTARHGRTISTNLGGGIFNGGTLTVSNSTVSGNTTIAFGGGIYAEFADTTVINSTLSGNSTAFGGGIHAFGGQTSFISSTLSGNVASLEGGAISVNDGIVNLTNSTLSGNSASQGGGIYNDFGSLTVTSSTLTGNSANGGGIYNNFGTTNVVIYSLLSGNPGGNCVNTPVNGSNIADDFSCAGATEKTAAEINLDPVLADNGGPTFTHALLLASHAIDHVASAACTGDPVNGVDQRGLPRNVNGNGAASANECDAGAYEYQPPPSACPVVISRTPISNVGYFMTDIVGNGMGDNRRFRTAARITIPDYEDVIGLYGQMAGKGPEYTAKKVRFIYPDGSRVDDFVQNSPAYQLGAIHWYGEELDPVELGQGPNSLKGKMRSRWFLTAEGRRMRTPRAVLYYPTYETDELYADVRALFPTSSLNHVAWETGYTPVQTLTIPIPETQLPVDIMVKLAIVGMDRDPRQVLVEVEAGGVVVPLVLTVPTNNPSLNIVEVLLEDVPAGTSEVTVRLESPDGGDSAALVGAVVNYACAVEGVPPTAQDDDFDEDDHDVPGYLVGNLFVDNGHGSDDLGTPAAVLVSFGGGTMGGDVTSNLPGIAVPFHSGLLTVNADGSFVLDSYVGNGPYTFDYRIQNAFGFSDATVTIHVEDTGPCRPGQADGSTAC